MAASRQGMGGNSMIYVIWFPFGNARILCGFKDSGKAESLLTLINMGREGTDAPMAEIFNVPVVVPVLDKE
jgi:hypothetical protein